MTPDGLITSEFDDAAVIDAAGAAPSGRAFGAGFRSLEDDLFDRLEPADFFDPYDRWETAAVAGSGASGDSAADDSAARSSVTGDSVTGSSATRSSATGRRGRR